MSTGEQLRNEGMARAEDDGTIWRARADQTMEHLIAIGTPFSANDFNDRMDAYLHRVAPKSPAAIGSLFGRYAKAGRIVRCGNARPTKASSHARTYALWINADAVHPAETIAESYMRQIEELKHARRLFIEAITDIGRGLEAELLTVQPTNRYREGRYEGLKRAIEIVESEINKERS